jgi:hypothetical protein
MFYYLRNDRDSNNPPRYSTQPNSDPELPLDPKWSGSNRKVAWWYIVISIAIAALGYALG